MIRQLILFLHCVVLLVYASALSGQTSKPNVILIVSDDLNDYLQVLQGQPQILTPNIQSLAEQGTTFENAYASAPGCAPSRASFMSGKDIDYIQVYNNNDYNNIFRDNFTEEKGNATVFTLPEVLKDSGGYYTYGINKIFHNSDKNDYDKTTADACAKEWSWNRMINFGDDTLIDTSAGLYNFQNGAFGFGALPDSLESYLQDYRATDTAIQFIKEFAEGTANTCDKPFFLAIGYSKPHQGLYVPEKYFPEYYKDNFTFSSSTVDDTLYNHPVSNTDYNGVVMPPQPYPMWNDYYQLGPIASILAITGDVLETIDNYVAGYTFDNNAVQNVVMENIRAAHVMAYMAAIQYIDAQVGRVIDSLAAYPELMNNTIIVLMSDHGFSLGEKMHWGKWTLWETDLRVPFIIVTPWGAGNQVVKKCVSYLDLFPTICSLTGTPLPTLDDGEQYVDGHDISPLLDNPDLQYELPAVSTYKRTGGNGSCNPTYSVRNERFHYIRYRNNNNSGTGVPCDDDSRFFEEELYDIGINREIDPYEWTNLATNEQYRPMIQFMAQWITDSVLYLTPSMKILPSTGDLPCLLDRYDTIALSATVINPDGSLNTGLESRYSCIWFGNWLNDTLTGLDVMLDLHNMKSGIDYIDKKFILYSGILDSETQKIIALSTLELFIGINSDPELSFNTVPQINAGVYITDINVDGIYSEILWDFGDGFTYTGNTPPVHEYMLPGTYLIQATVIYGNDCERSFYQEFSTVDFPDLVFSEEPFVFPNPADTYINLITNSNTAGVIYIYDAMGKLMYQLPVGQAGFKQYYIDVNFWASGIYFINLVNVNASLVKSFIIQ